MKNQITTCKDGDIVINAARGTLALDDFIAYLKVHQKDWGTSPVLWVLTDVDIGHLAEKDIQAFLDKSSPFVKRRAGMKTAIVAPAEPVFRHMKMFEHLLQVNHLPINLRVFETVSEASEWLLV